MVWPSKSGGHEGPYPVLHLADLEPLGADQPLPLRGNCSRRHKQSCGERIRLQLDALALLAGPADERRSCRVLKQIVLSPLGQEQLPVKLPMTDFMSERETKAGRGRGLFVWIKGLVDDHFRAFDPEGTQDVGSAQSGAQIVEAEMKSQMILEDILDGYGRTDFNALPPSILSQQDICVRLDLGGKKVGHLQRHCRGLLLSSPQIERIFYPLALPGCLFRQPLELLPAQPTRGAQKRGELARAVEDDLIQIRCHLAG